MSLTVIELLSNGCKLPFVCFVQIPDSCFIPNNSALHKDKFARRTIEELLTKR